MLETIISSPILHARNPIPKYPKAASTELSATLSENLRDLCVDQALTIVPRREHRDFAESRELRQGISHSGRNEPDNYDFCAAFGKFKGNAGRVDPCSFHLIDDERPLLIERAFPISFAAVYKHE